MKRKREESNITINYFNIDKPIDPIVSLKIFQKDLEHESFKQYLEDNKRSIMRLPDELIYMIYDRLNATWKSVLRLVNKRLYILYWTYQQLSIKKYTLYQKNWNPFEAPSFYDIKNINIHTNNIYQFKKNKKRKYEEIEFYKDQHKDQERWISVVFENKHKTRKLIRTEYGYCCNNINHANLKTDAWLISKKAMYYKDKNICHKCKKFDYCIKLYSCNTCLQQKNHFCIHYLQKTKTFWLCKICYNKI
jgi:hypothetical protein